MLAPLHSGWQGQVQQVQHDRHLQHAEQLPWLDGGWWRAWFGTMGGMTMEGFAAAGVWGLWFWLGVVPHRAGWPPLAASTTHPPDE